jgi:hypothetical protein
MAKLRPGVRQSVALTFFYCLLRSETEKIKICSRRKEGLRKLYRLIQPKEQRMKWVFRSDLMICLFGKALVNTETMHF